MNSIDVLMTLFCLAGLLVLARLLASAFRRIRCPDLLGAVLAGVLLRPMVMGLLGGGEVDLSANAVLDGVYWIGLTALMFTAGAILRPDAGIRVSGPVFLLMAGALVALLVAFASSRLFTDLIRDARLASDAASLDAYRLVIALAAVVTSVPFLSKIFLNVGLMGTPFARNILIAACLLDIMLWSLVPVASALRTAAGQDAVTIALPLASTLGFVLAVLALGRRACLLGARKLEARRFPGRGAAGVVGLCLCVQVLAGWLGVNPMVSAALAGYCAGQARDAFGGGVERVERWSEALAIPLYFAVIGLSLDIVRDTQPELVLGFLLWSSLIKAACVFGTMWIATANSMAALHYAVAMNTRGGPGIALASLALGLGLIGEPTFLALIVASLATAAFTEPWLKAFRPALVADTLSFGRRGAERAQEE